MRNPIAKIPKAECGILLNAKLKSKALFRNYRAMGWRRPARNLPSPGPSILLARPARRPRRQVKQNGRPAMAAAPLRSRPRRRSGLASSPRTQVPETREAGPIFWDGPEAELTEASVREAIVAVTDYVHLGNLAVQLHVSRTTLWEFIRVRPELAALIRNNRGQMLDLAHERLRIAVDKKKPWAIQFALETIGQQRGYSTDPEPGADQAEEKSAASGDTAAKTSPANPRTSEAESKSEFTPAAGAGHEEEKAPADAPGSETNDPARGFPNISRGWTRRAMPC